jgi:hypothetical protein
MTPPLEAITVANLLTNILEARADLAMASYYGGDFVTSSVASSIIRVRYAELLRRSQLNTEARQQFVEVLLPQAPSLSEAIDSGERSMDEFFRLLDKGGRFRDWLGTVNPDDKLIHAYITAKTIRYVLTTAAGAVVSPVTSAAVGFADSFVVDKLLSGWRPNHFIDRRLSPFVRGR